jgi:hypothetical protein
VLPVLEGRAEELEGVPELFGGTDEEEGRELELGLELEPPIGRELAPLI